jgi:hypothetical protein
VHLSVECAVRFLDEPWYTDRTVYRDKGRNGLIPSGHAIETRQGYLGIRLRDENRAVFLQDDPAHLWAIQAGARPPSSGLGVASCAAIPVKLWSEAHAFLDFSRNGNNFLESVPTSPEEVLLIWT